MLFFSFFFGFSGPQPWHMQGLGLGLALELSLPACATATATQDPSHVGDHHSSRQRQVLNPLCEAGEGTCLLMDTTRVR